MRKVPSTNTHLEWIVRRLVHRMDSHYRLHRKNLPSGAPVEVEPGILVTYAHERLSASES